MSPPSDGTCFSYRIDAENRIVSVSANWDAFAIANDGPEAVAARVVGRDLFAAISGLETTHLYRSILQRVRRGQRPLRSTFRCDSPDTKRLFAMEVEPAGEEVMFVTTLLAHEPAGTSILLEDLGERMRDFVSMCVYCRGIRAPQEAWRPLGASLRALRLFEARRLPRLSHGICPDCYTVHCDGK